MPKRDVTQSPTETEADFPERQIAQRRDETIRRMMNTPYAPQQKPKKAAKKKKAKAKA